MRCIAKPGVDCERDIARVDEVLDLAGWGAVRPGAGASLRQRHQFSTEEALQQDCSIQPVSTLTNTQASARARAPRTVSNWSTIEYRRPDRSSRRNC